jgi:hypothetical protein
MLDEFLEVAYVTETKKQATFELVGLLKELPDMELRKLAAGTPIAELYHHLDKTAAQCGPDGEPMSFLDRFKGTALFEQAIALEQQELQAEMTDMQKRQEQRAQRQGEDSIYDQKDRIRVQKRLLELELAKQEGAGGEDPNAPPGAAPPPMEPPGAGPAAPAALPGAPGEAKVAFIIGGTLGAIGGHKKAPAERKGEGALRGAIGGGGGELAGALAGGLVSHALRGRGGSNLLVPLGQLAGGIGGYKAMTRKYDKKKKEAADKLALSEATITGAVNTAKKWGAMDPSRMARVAALGQRVANSANSAVAGQGKALLKTVTAEAQGKLAFADNLGRMLARNDADRALHAGELHKVGSQAGAALAKMALDMGAITKAIGSARAAAAPLAGKAVKAIAANPNAALAVGGAAAGAGAGAIAGGPGHRLSGAAGGAALGGAAGYGAGRLGAGKALQGAMSGNVAKAVGAGEAAAPGLAHRVESAVAGSASPHGALTPAPGTLTGNLGKPVPAAPMAGTLAPGGGSPPLHAPVGSTRGGPMSNFSGPGGAGGYASRGQAMQDIGMASPVQRGGRQAGLTPKGHARNTLDLLDAAG